MKRVAIFSILCCSLLPCVAGCYQVPRAQKIEYSESDVERVNAALASYDWSDFEP